DDQEIDEPLFVLHGAQETREPCCGVSIGIVFPVSGRTQSLYAGDDRKTSCPGILILKQVQGLLGIAYLGRHAELIRKFPTPLFPECCRTKHKQTPHIEAASQLRPDKASFDRLSKPHFIRNEDAVAGRLENFE